MLAVLFILSLLTLYEKGLSTPREKDDIFIMDPAEAMIEDITKTKRYFEEDDLCPRECRLDTSTVLSKRNDKKKERKLELSESLQKWCKVLFFTWNRKPCHVLLKE